MDLHLLSGLWCSSKRKGLKYNCHARIFHPYAVCREGTLPNFGALDRGVLGAQQVTIDPVSEWLGLRRGAIELSRRPKIAESSLRLFRLSVEFHGAILTPLAQDYVSRFRARHANQPVFLSCCSLKPDEKLDGHNMRSA